MIKTLLIADDQELIDQVIQTVEGYCPNVNITETIHDLRSGVAAINRYAPDLILLDLSLPDGSGFDLIRHFDKPDFRVIFFSRHMEYAIQAIKFNAVDFIVKPVDEKEVALAIDKAAEMILLQEKFRTKSLEDNLEALTKSNNLVLKTSDQIHVLNTADIIRMEADGSYCTFYISDGRKVMISKPLVEYEESLADQGFYRIHKSHVVNIKHLKYLDKADGGYVVMSDKARVPVASRKRDMILELFEKLA
ncbi:MAG: response regulator transcription factor [Bacteroidales bacterium]|nr:response regulator transcription factor [Bacteroidales bacterium]